MQSWSLFIIFTLWCRLEDMFQLIVTPQGIEKVTIQLKDTPTKVYTIGAKLFFIKGAPKSAWKLSIDLITNSHSSYVGKSTGSINGTVSSNWNQRVLRVLKKGYIFKLDLQRLSWVMNVYAYIFKQRPYTDVTFQNFAHK